MTVCLFVGPSLDASEICLEAETVLLPPVAQGDVWRAIQRRPKAIGIIDGYFSGAPSVWHKEVLWALSEGIHVFGSASMGALRAAELHAFGMRGIGRIFEAYRDGELEDDDEVAVVHGPAELGYPPLSEAMVNIRATLERASSEGVLSEAMHQRLVLRAKSLHFPERTWAGLLGAGRWRGADETEIAALRDWLPQGRVDQKRNDALEMLRCMQKTLDAQIPPAASFRFQWTHFWDALVTRASGYQDRAAAGQQRILEELRLEGPEAVERVGTRALVRELADATIRREGTQLPEEILAQTLTRFRDARGLYTRERLERWLAENALDATALEWLLAREARLGQVRHRFRGVLDRAMLDELRLSSEYPGLAERSRRKCTLESRADALGAEFPSPLQLRLWYFEKRLRQPMPDDMVQYTLDLGFATLAKFDDALRREYAYHFSLTDVPEN